MSAENNERIAVFGCGALGGYAGGYLTRDGRDVTMIDPWPDHVVAMGNPGLKLEGQSEPENFTVKANAILLGDLPPPDDIEAFDIVFIAVKAFDTDVAAARIAPYLADDGVAVSLQNGINEHRIAAAVGDARTVGCIASQIAVALPEPGHILRKVKLGGAQHTVFRVGELDGRVTPRVERIAEMLSSIDSAIVTDNLMGERWSKLVANAMRNPVSAATDQGANQNDRDETIRSLSVRLAAETITVAKAEGANLVKVLGIDPDVLQAAGQGDTDAYAHVTEKFFAAMARRSDSQRPSMCQDISKGRPTEIDFINGLVVEHAGRHGIPVPANEAIVQIIKKIEAGELTPAPGLLSNI